MWRPSACEPGHSLIPFITLRGHFEEPNVETICLRTGPLFDTFHHSLGSLAEAKCRDNLLTNRAISSCLSLLFGVVLGSQMSRQSADGQCHCLIPSVTLGQPCGGRKWGETVQITSTFDDLGTKSGVKLGRRSTVEKFTAETLRGASLFSTQHNNFTIELQGYIAAPKSVLKRPESAQES